jgi:CBS domain containing-hemolysin-like protein
MQEMALISFNRLRLEHNVRKGSVRAVWIKKLLDNPTALFGTTLIGVNIALVISSESIRRLFLTLDLNPNYSVFVAAPYMIIFGELVPMFAARVYPEHMARIGIPLLYISSTVFAPVAKLFDSFFQSVRKLFFSKNLSLDSLHLQRDELQNLVQERAVEYFDTATGQLESTVSKMFHLKDKEISSIMTPVDQYLSLQSTYLCSAAKERFLEQQPDLAMVVNRQKKLIGHFVAWDLIFANPTASIGSIIRPVTYVGGKTTIIDTLFRMKKDHTEGAFVVGTGGVVEGFVSLDDILMQIACDEYAKSLLHLEITVTANTKLADFFETYRLTLPQTDAKTFRALIDEVLGHKPSVKESIRFGSIEIIVKEVTIRGAKTIMIRTVE